MQLIEFIIGGLIANSLAHLVIGFSKVRFLGLFGYTPKGNIWYAIVQFIAAIILLLINYNFEELFKNGFVLGGLAVLVSYFVAGHFLFSKFRNDPNKEIED